MSICSFTFLQFLGFLIFGRFFLGGGGLLGGFSGYLGDFGSASEL